VFKASGFTIDLDWVELDYEVGVGIVDTKELSTAGTDLHAKFFGQFPVDSRLKRFSRLQFPPRELPKIAMALMGRTLADEELAIAFYHGCYHANFVDFAHWQLFRIQAGRGIVWLMDDSVENTRFEIENWAVRGCC
jgi:hypothetical protein